MWPGRLKAYLCECGLDDLGGVCSGTVRERDVALMERRQERKEQMREGKRSEARDERNGSSMESACVS